MTREIIIHAADYPVEKESLRILIEKNLSGKLDTYINKLIKEGENLRVELTTKRENDNQASGKLVISVGTKTFRSERENFDNLADLVNHLFTHIKEQMAK
jgi:hypothetical protein